MPNLPYQAILLTPEGVRALAHLQDCYIRDGNIIECNHFSVQMPFVEVKARLQRPGLEEIVEAHLLIPHQYVSLVVLNEPDKKLGFAQA